MFYTVTFFFILIMLLLLWECKKPRNFPPGPRWYPIVGCAFQLFHIRLRESLMCKVIDELVKTYTNSHGVLGLKIGRDKIVVVHETKAIQELGFNEELDGRPDGIFYQTRTFNSRKGILVTDEEFWIEQRRFIIRHLKEFGFARRDITIIIRDEAQYLADDIQRMITKQGGREAVISIDNLFQVYVLNSLWRLMASKRYDSESEDFLGLLHIFTDLLKHVDMFGAMFSQFPVLRYIAPDLSRFKSFVDSHKRFYNFLRKEVNEHRKMLNLNEPPRDLMDAYLLEIAKRGHSGSFSDEQLMSVCLDLFLAGSETTNKTLGFIFLHILKNPLIQAKALAELDAVVGRERQPCLEDRPNLPYCEAITYEGLRFFMGHTFAVPHRALKDTKLCGFNIPKGTMVVGCYRGMLMNPDDYPEPERFYPERYFVDGQFKPPKFSAFGYGRHRCMGESLAKQSLFVFTATLLQRFSFNSTKECPLDEVEPIDGVTASPGTFSALVVPRF